MNYFRSFIVLFAFFLLSIACSLAQQYSSDMNYSPAAKYRFTGQGQRVELMDQGLKMPMGSGTIPKDWQLIQDIATNPNTGMYDRYHQEIRGKQGELILSLAPVMYSSTIGKDFQRSLEQTVTRALQSEITSLTLGTVQRSETLENIRQFREMARIMHVEGWEASIRGTRNGETISGIVHVILMKLPQHPNAGTYTSSVVLSPSHLLVQTLQTAEKIRDSFQPNPQWQARVRQIMQPSVPYGKWQHDTTAYDHQEVYDSLSYENYWGENDPVFNPDSLQDVWQDDWQEITPQDPGY